MARTKEALTPSPPFDQVYYACMMYEEDENLVRSRSCRVSSFCCSLGWWLLWSTIHLPIVLDRQLPITKHQVCYIFVCMCVFVCLSWIQVSPPEVYVYLNVANRRARALRLQFTNRNSLISVSVWLYSE